VKGDSVYSLKWNYTTADFLGQEFKFGIGAFDNEGGFGNNHIENIDDAAATYTIASQFGSIDPSSTFVELRPQEASDSDGR